MVKFDYLKKQIMNIEREIKVRDAIKYCIENFDSHTATNRIVDFWKDELKLQEQKCNISNIVGRSEQLMDFTEYCNDEHGLFIPSWMIDNYNGKV